MKELIRNQIKNAGIGDDRLLESEPMSNYTSFRIGGDADFLVTVNNESELSALLKTFRENETKHIIIGNGSNLLFSDDGYRGVVVKLGGDFEEVILEGETLVAGSGALLSRVSRIAAENGLSGMEFASGIPGSIGGAVFMNAGAYGGEMKDIVETVFMIPDTDGESFSRSGDEMGFAYRRSRLCSEGGVVTFVRLKLNKGDREEILSKMSELKEKRNSKQPVNFPSAGSTFKRPAGGFAAALIEEAGLKGVSVGGAQVSEKHSGFIINTGDATFSDVVALIEKVRNRVYENSGVWLEPEVRIVGGNFDGND